MTKSEVTTWYFVKMKKLKWAFVHSAFNNSKKPNSKHEQSMKSIVKGMVWHLNRHQGKYGARHNWYDTVIKSQLKYVQNGEPDFDYLPL